MESADMESADMESADMESCRHGILQTWNPADMESAETRWNLQKLGGILQKLGGICRN